MIHLGANSPGTECLGLLDESVSYETTAYRRLDCSSNKGLVRLPTNWLPGLYLLHQQDGTRIALWSSQVIFTTIVIIQKNLNAVGYRTNYTIYRTSCATCPSTSPYAGGLSWCFWMMRPGLAVAWRVSAPLDGTESPWKAFHSLSIDLPSLEEILYVCILMLFPSVVAKCSWLPNPEKYRSAIASLCPTLGAFLDIRSKVFVPRLAKLPFLGKLSSFASVVSEVVSILPRQGDIHRLNKGAIGGRFVVIRATKVSRMAHIPLLLCFGSYSGKDVRTLSSFFEERGMSGTYFEHQDSPCKGNTSD